MNHTRTFHTLTSVQVQNPKLFPKHSGQNAEVEMKLVFVFCPFDTEFVQAVFALDDDGAKCEVKLDDVIVIDRRGLGFSNRRKKCSSNLFRGNIPMQKQPGNIIFSKF